MPDRLQTQAEFTEYFPLNSMIRANVTFGEKRCFCPRHYTLNFSPDRTHLGVKPVQLQIAVCLLGERSGAKAASQRIPLSPVCRVVWSVYLSAFPMELKYRPYPCLLVRSFILGLGNL